MFSSTSVIATMCKCLCDLHHTPTRFFPFPHSLGVGKDARLFPSGSESACDVKGNYFAELYVKLRKTQQKWIIFDEFMLKNMENCRIIGRQNKEVVVGVVMIKMYRQMCICKRGCVDKDENAHV